MLSEIVIARYCEELEWITRIPAGFSVTVYNKGPEIISPPVLARVNRLETLPNNGRESDTFLRHILGQRPLATDYTVFLQGDPFEHSPDLIDLLNARPSWQDLQPLSWRWLSGKNIPPADLLERETDYYVAGSRVRPELFSLATWGPIQFSDSGTGRTGAEYRELHGLPNGVNIAAHFLRRCEWNELAAQAEANLVGCFSYGALLAVKTGSLAALPRRSLELALEAANAHHMYGYVLERLWLHMFGQPFLLPAASPQRFEENLSKLTSRFAPRPTPRHLPLRQRIVPAAKRRIAAWALGEQQA